MQSILKSAVAIVLLLGAPSQLIADDLTFENFENQPETRWRFFADTVMGGVSELCLNLGDAHHQAAWFSVSPVTSTPSLNLIPSMTFGNWFLP
ncbi:MAG: hypothetical protein ACI9KK_001580, partial [Ascidiaceihabitans sp.]